MKLNVPDMSCGHCKAAVESAIAKIGGSAVVHLAARQVVVEGASLAEATEALKQAGYEATPAEE